jgi:hypothetical protein
MSSFVSAMRRRSRRSRRRTRSLFFSRTLMSVGQSARSTASMSIASSGSGSVGSRSPRGALYASRARRGSSIFVVVDLGDGEELALVTSSLVAAMPRS